MEKKSLWQSYVAGITDRMDGERYGTIIGYFLPELVTAFMVYSVLNCIDAAFIGHLKSTSLYATQGVTSTFIHFLTKVAEGISVGTVVLCGQYNGLQRFSDVGRAAATALWVTVGVGGAISLFLYFGAPAIYSFLQVPEQIASHGVAYLQLRSLGIFLSFLYFALVGFLRGVKNTRLPMLVFVLGGFVFVLCDYALVFGAFGLPEMGLQGSAIASIIQHAVMLCAIITYIVMNKNMRKYSVSLVSGFDRPAAGRILRLSWPVMLDKAVLALAKIWLVKLLAPMGKVALASFSVIKDMEQLAFVPAAAFAQVITLLVSNDFGIKNWQGIKNNTKKILFMASFAVITILLAFSIFPEKIIHIFDTKNAFTAFAATLFPMISLFVMCDVLQLILAGALRGAANVRFVMMTRVLVGLFVFLPLSYGFSIMPISNILIKFFLVYSSYYLANGVMGLIYVYRFRREGWKYDAEVAPVRMSYGTNNGKRDSASGESVSN